LFPQAVRWHIQTAPLGVAILALWGPSLRVCWCAGVLVRRSVGVLVCWCADVGVFRCWYVGVLMVFWCVCVLVCRYGGVLARWYAGDVLVC
jgi:hypothetical protein